MARFVIIQIATLRTGRAPDFSRVSRQALVATHTLAFQKSVYAGSANLPHTAETPRLAKLAASASLVLWLAILVRRPRDRVRRAQGGNVLQIANHPRLSLGCAEVSINTRRDGSAGWRPSPEVWLLQLLWPVFAAPRFSVANEATTCQGRDRAICATASIPEAPGYRRAA